MALVEFQGRRETREPVEMMARFRHHITTVTVMLKDITQHGAKIEGMAGLMRDDAAFLMLPCLAPKLVFVAWSNGHGAGLEFDEPLDNKVFYQLVRDFGRRFETLPKVA
jgi:hypothetical protein